MTTTHAVHASVEAGRQTLPEIRPAPSRRRRLVLTVAVAAFLLWIGYLAVLAVTSSHPVVLSRPQVLVSNSIVVAQLTGGPEHPESTAVIKEVVWSADPATQPKVGANVAVRKLVQINADGGWRGPGEYILPLTQLLDGTRSVTPIPPSPGLSETEGRIYAATPSTREQLAQILKQYRRQ
jgi:hypothetical protein